MSLPSKLMLAGIQYTSVVFLPFRLVAVERSVWWICDRPPLEPPPVGLDRMLAAAAGLGSGWDFIRIDLYNIGERVYFGEFTPYPGSGLDRIIPASVDRELGARWKLPGAVSAAAGATRSDDAPGRLRANSCAASAYPQCHSSY